MQRHTTLEENTMNALHTSLRTTLITLVILNALAGEATRAAQPTAFMQIDCSRRYISQADAARLFGTNNVSHVYARRQTLYANLARACAGGAGTVTLASVGNRSATFARIHGR